MRRFIYKEWNVTVAGKEYFVESLATGSKELLHFESDLECMAHLDKRSKEGRKQWK